MRKLVILGLVFLIFTFEAFAQSIKLPCIDGKVKTDETYFKYPQADLDSLILLSQKTYSFFAINGLDAILNVAFVIDTNSTVKEVEVKDYKITYAFGDSKMRLFDPVELGNGRRHCYAEIKRLLELTNGMWFIGTKKGKKLEQKSVVTIRFYTDAYKENKRAMEEAQSTLQTQYDKVKVTPALNIDLPLSFYRLKPYAKKSIESNKFDLAKLLLIEHAGNFPNDIKGKEELGDLFHEINDDVRACENWNKCKGSKTALEKKALYCK